MVRCWRELQTTQPRLRVVTVDGGFDLRGDCHVWDEVVGLGTGGQACRDGFGDEGLDVFCKGRVVWRDQPERSAGHDWMLWERRRIRNGLTNNDD